MAQTIDIVTIAQEIGNRAYERQLPAGYEEASKAYTISTQAALDVLRDIEERQAVDPMAPDYGALGREPLGSGMADSRDSAEAPGIQ